MGEQVEEWKQVSYRMPVGLTKRLKVVAAIEGKTQNEIVVGMIDAYVSKREKEFRETGA